MCFGIQDKEADDIVSKLSTLKQEERERIKTIKNYENEVVKCEAEIAKPPPPDLGTIEQCKDEVVCIPHRLTILDCTDNLCVIRERSIQRGTTLYSAGQIQIIGLKNALTRKLCPVLSMIAPKKSEPNSFCGLKKKKNGLLTNSLFRLKKQDDADVQKLQMMAKWDRDTHDAILWLRANKNKFRMEVFEPPFMSLSIKDRRYTNAIEACFAGNQIKV